MYYYYFYSFIIYSFIGWVTEVSYHIYKLKNFANRGFLYGPICPIYGGTAVILIFFLTPYSNNEFITFFGGALIASIIEYGTGYAMEKMFHAKWWDYSDEKFNIKGYICLKFSILWGFMSLIFIKYVNPNISNITYYLMNNMGEVLYNILLVLFITDVVLTINGLITFRKLFTELQEVIIERTEDLEKLNIASLNKEIKDEISERLGILHEIKERLLNRISVKQKHFLKAFPHISSNKFQQALEDLISKINNIN
ncbi:MAG: putative ABC transporter permease [Clostridiaceae bacterium]